MSEEKLRQVDEYRWLLPRDESRGMRTDGMVFADEKLVVGMSNDPTLEQVANVACLPGIVGNSLAMPDAHCGYGFPIGGVAAFDVEEGVISPGGVGYDINCGVRLVRSDLMEDELGGRLERVVDGMFGRVPAGVGKEGSIKLDKTRLERVLTEGARWVVARGDGSEEDLRHTEAGGCLEGADASSVSKRAMERGRGQLGTLGSGNHFLEIQAVDRIDDAETAAAFGIEGEGQICVMIHCGSRGFGHQVCDDAIGTMLKAAEKYGIELPDRQLACAPVNSEEGRTYYAAMAAAANYAWANRQVIMQRVREVFEEVFGSSAERLGLRLVYDVAHNVAKFERHRVDGVERELCVHRKGATRAFGPGDEELPEEYRQHGQPVLVPGDMGRGSYVLAGTQGAMEQTWGSTAHGAGRVLSRKAAIRKQHSNEVRAKLKEQGILVRSVGKKTLAEEAPDAYKDVDEVVAVCDGAGISRRVARLRPLAVVKG